MLTMQLDPDEYRLLSRRGSVPLARRPRPQDPGVESDEESREPLVRQAPRHRILAQRLAGAAALTRAAAAAGFQDRYRDL